MLTWFVSHRPFIPSQCLISILVDQHPSHHSWLHVSIHIVPITNAKTYLFPHSPGIIHGMQDSHHVTPVLLTLFSSVVYYLEILEHRCILMTS